MELIPTKLHLIELVSLWYEQFEKFILEKGHSY